MQRDIISFYDKPISDNEVTSPAFSLHFRRSSYFQSQFFLTLVIRLLISYHFVLVYRKFLLRIDLLGFVYSGKPSDETHYIPINLIKCLQKVSRC